ncbi:MAG: hypothetical protein WCU88_02450 [Elusimicrobiota bacterium]|jgi:hypothetical protein
MGNSWLSGQAVISGSMTIQGSAFSVAGTSFAVNSGNIGIGIDSPQYPLQIFGGIRASSMSLSGTGNNIYTLTISSSVHILNGGIFFADGTTLNSPSNIATSTLDEEFTTTGASIAWKTIENSTITLQIGDSRVRMDYSCPVVETDENFQTASILLGTRMDADEIPEGQSNMIGLGLNYDNSAAFFQAHMLAFTYITPSKLSAGQHSFWLVVKTDQIEARINPDGMATCMFSVQELIE